MAPNVPSIQNALLIPALMEPVLPATLDSQGNFATTTSALLILTVFLRLVSKDTATSAEETMTPAMDKHALLIQTALLTTALMGFVLTVQMCQDSSVREECANRAKIAVH